MLDELQDKLIHQAIEDIKEYTNMGWNVDKAIQTVRDSSTLGYGSWQKVLETVEPQYRGYQDFRSHEL